MSALVPHRPQPTPLSMLSVASSRSEARDALEALRQAHALFAGVYGSLWAPAQNAHMAWLVVLGDATAAEIASAAVAYVRDTAPSDNGQPRSKYPPQPCDLAAIVKRRRAAEAKRFAELRHENDKAIESAERVVGLKASGRWDALPKRERDELASWAARGEVLLAERAERNGEPPHHSGLDSDPDSDLVRS